MSAMRTSSRQAALKAKEAIDTGYKPATATKRKGATRKAPAPKKSKKADEHARPEVKNEDKRGEKDVKTETIKKVPKEEHSPTTGAEGNVNGFIYSSLDLRYCRYRAKTPSGW